MDGPRSPGYGARSGYDVRTRRLRGGPEGRHGVNRPASPILLLRARLALRRRLASVRGPDAERGDHAPAGAHEIGARAIRSDTAAAHSRAFDQEKERVGKEVRLRGAGALEWFGEALALPHLEPLDHAKTGVPLFGKSAGGVGKIAA